jgi:ketoreductase RED2
VTGALDGQVAIVTGSSSGIGEAIARRFALDGASLVINSSRSVDAGTAVAADLPDAIYVQADISDEEQGQRLVQAALDRWGRLDVLVNNAGTTEVIPHADLDAAGLEVWQRIFEVNVFGTWLVSRAAVPALRETHGSIVNITSLAGIRPTGSSIPYAASKAALNHLTHLMAKVLGPEVRVNAIAPGLVDTPWTADWEASRARVESLAPLRRSGRPEDVGGMALALATSSYITGEVVVIDGGLNLAP